MSKLKSKSNWTIRTGLGTQDQWVELCELLQKSKFLWRSGRSPSERSYSGNPRSCVVLDTKDFRMGRLLHDADNTKYNYISVEYAIFLLEDYLYEQT